MKDIEDGRKEENNVVDFFKNYFKKDWSFDDKVITTAFCALAGILIGIFISPIKYGITTWSYNGCNNGSNNVNDKSYSKNKPAQEKEKNKDKKKEETEK